FRGADLAVANTAFVLMYQLGAMVGPALGGAAMQRFGPDALPLTLALALALFTAGAACGLFLRRAPGARPQPAPARRAR
ncbi:MAG TPA: hypothetical protein VFO09_08640, partial [Methyloceanibacter sp.]|nr:hypothetical protein [Methyloceanibacter sp.]